MVSANFLAKMLVFLILLSLLKLRISVSVFDVNKNIKINITTYELHPYLRISIVRIFSSLIIWIELL